MNDLEILRKKIDEIDSQLLPLFLSRMECSAGVAEYKRANNMPVLDKQREKQILENKIEKVSNELKIPVYDFFSTIMKISRVAQAKALVSEEGRTPWLKDFDEGELKSDPTVAYQGVPGANSETALIQFFGKDCKRINTSTFGKVVDAVENGEADYGILPLENSSTGVISSAYDLLEKRDAFIVAEVAVPIDHCLVGLPDAKLEYIRTVYSHEQGYMQCKEFFDKYPKMEFHPYHNTAMAAKMIVETDDIDKAAIASKRTTEIYNLKVLAENISTIGGNTTRFAVIAKRGILNKSCRKISILFTLPDESGALSHVLSVFADNGLNLVKIESRPSHDGNFEYLFFVDFEGSLLDNTVNGIMAEISASTSSLKILGNYSVSE
ncbi:MAG: prephenate dehydratase [Clostridia bacterium]|nr:prephenate dehydratase [Clostridia bacterium]